MKNFSLVELEALKLIELGRGKVISKKDLNANPGNYPVYSSAKTGGGVFGTWGNYDFNEEMITWSVDGGGDLFHRNKHKFSITNVGGFIRVLDKNRINTKYLYYALKNLHNGIKFDWVKKAHPSVLRKEYNYIPVPSLQEQEKIVERLYKVFENINIDLSTTKKMIEYNDSLKQSRIDYLFKSISDKSDKFKLLELGELITGNTPNTQEKDNYGNAIPFIKPGDFNQDGGLNYNNQGLSKKGKLKARLVNKNSVLMVCIGATIGKVGITSKEITTNQQINSIVPSNKIDSYFLYYQMLTTKFQKLVLDSSSQATLPIINKKKWGQIIVDVPTKAIQKESAKALDHFIFLNNDLNLKFKLKIKLLKELKKSILIKEFSNE